MAEENPQNVNPATDPQVEEPAGTTVPLSVIDTEPTPVSPETNPEVPQPSIDIATITASQPDAAFQRAQQAKEERWQTAAAANPDGISNNGSVSVDLGDGQREIINRDGSFSIAGPQGEYRYNADGQLESYTTPNIGGLTQTYTTDGVIVETFQQGGLRTESISYNGELVSTNTTLQIGDQTLQQIQVGEGPPVNAAITRVPITGTAGLQITQAQVGDGEIVTSTLDLEQRRLDRLAADEARAEAADQLRQDIRASQAQVESGIPLSATQLAAIEEQARALEAAEAEVLQAEEALAEADPTIVAADTDPQVVEAVDQDPIPSFDTTEFAPAPIDPANDAAVAEFAAAQEGAEFVPVADIDTGPEAVTQDEEIISFEEQQATADFVAEADIDTGPADVTQDEEIISFEETQAQNDFVPAADIDTGPAEVDPADDAELAGIAAAQAATEIADSEIELDPTVVSDADPQLPPDDQPIRISNLIEPLAEDPQAEILPDGLPEAFIYTAAETPVDDPIILAQADTTSTDVVLVDLIDGPSLVDQDIDSTAFDQPLPPQGGFFGEPLPIGGNFTASYDPETGTYSVVDLDTGETVETGLSQQQATLAAQEFSLGDPQFPNETDALGAAADSDIIREPTDVDVAEAQFIQTNTGFFELQEEAAPQPDEFGFVEADTGFFVQQEELEAQIDQQQFEDQLVQFDVPIEDVDVEPDPVINPPYEDEPEDTLLDLNTGERVTAGQAQASAAIAQAAVNRARNQQSIREQRRNNPDSADWRVRIRLAPNSTYLYNADDPGILAPLSSQSGSDGVIFPYTPTISTVYKANYSSYDLTHSNYRGFFYQSSMVEDINITGVFTAQDTVEAEYLLAVIHFFRSASKMFYGQDTLRGAPPPLVYLSAFGQYQYVDAPCVISQFNYNLPADVDYIRARSPNQDGTNLLKRRDRNYLPTNAFSAALQRLKNAVSGGLPPGGQRFRPPPPTLGLNSPTYVPTRMEMTIVLHPMQSRQQVSQQFSLKDYASGRLQPRGYW